MMEQNGLGRLTYWTVTYLFNYLLYIPIAIEITIVSYIFQIRLFTQVSHTHTHTLPLTYSHTLTLQTNGLVLFLLLVMWGHSVVVLGFFFSTLFSRPRTATFVGYLIVVASVIVAALLETLQVCDDDVMLYHVTSLAPVM